MSTKGGLTTLCVCLAAVIAWGFSPAAAIAQSDSFRLYIESPYNNTVYRPGQQITIEAQIDVAYQNLTLEYGEGMNPTAWSSAGMTITASRSGAFWGRIFGPVGTWDTTAVVPDKFYTLRVRINGTEEAHVHLLYFDSRLKAGWPVRLPALKNGGGAGWQDLALADLDGDGHKEIIISDNQGRWNEPHKLSVFRDNGALWWQADAGPGRFSNHDVIAVGDVNGDSRPDIVFVSELQDGTSRVDVYNYDGGNAAWWTPYVLHSSVAAPVIADLDRDGKGEVIVRTNYHGAGKPELVVLNAKGGLISRRELTECNVPERAASVAVANMDDDPELEIVTTINCRDLSVLNADGSSAAPYFPVTLPASLVVSPVLGDVDKDGQADIVVALDNLWGGKGGVYVYNRRGQLLPGWPVLPELRFYAETPALADLNRDGYLEVLFPKTDLDLQYVYTRQGQPLAGWPQQLFPAGSDIIGNIYSSNIIADVDGDGALDVVVSAGGIGRAAFKGDFSDTGGVLAWKADGQRIDLNGNGPSQGLLIEGGIMKRNHGYFSGRKGAPAAVDIDGDGKLELIAATRNDVAMECNLDRPVNPDTGSSTDLEKGTATIYVWELEAPARASAAPWPAYQQNMARTGFIEAAVASRQNEKNRYDVNNDGKVTPLDALAVINLLNGQSSASVPYPDVNGDGMVTALDALTIINYLNSPSPGAEGEAAEAPVYAPKADLVALSASGEWWVAKSTGSGFANDARWGNWAAGSWLDVRSGDINGDGKLDIVARNPKGEWWVEKSTGSAFVNEKWGAWNAGAWFDVLAADVNGDGKTDLIGRNAKGEWWVARSTGLKFVAERWGVWSPLPWFDVLAADVNGDGKADVVGRAPSGQLWVARSTGTKFVNESWGAWSAIWWRYVRAADLNGDGKADLIGQAPSGDWYAALSSGSSFVNRYFGPWTPAGWSDVMVGDVNGDGKADVVARNANGGWWVARSTGSAFVNENWGSWPQRAWQDVRIGDLDGDGKADLFGRASNGERWVAKSTGTAFKNEIWGSAPAGAWSNVMLANVN